MKITNTQPSYAQLWRAAERYRREYRPGDRLVLIHMEDPYHPVEDGTRGTLDHIDDCSQFHMIWDNGRTLALVPQVDQFRRLTKTESYEEQRLAEFADTVISTMRPGYAALTFVTEDEEHGIHVTISDTAYNVAACDYEYGNAAVYNIRSQESRNVAIGDVEGLLNAARTLLAKLHL